MKKDSRLIPILVFSSIAIIYALPILCTFSSWGENDWDQFLFWNAVPRITVLEYHQFPLWNPYGNGGNVLLAHPHSSFLSPFYIFVLILGPLAGLKLEIIAHLFLGLLGMYLLCRHFRLFGYSSYAPPFLFMLCSIFSLHIAEGHASWLAMAFFPWLFLFYEKAINSKKCIFGGILSLSLMFFAGSVDVLHISVTFLSLYALFKAIQRKSFIPLVILVFIFAGSALLSAIKLVPMLEFMRQNPRLIPENDGVGFGVLARMLIGTRQALYAGSDGATKYDWHEYGTYIGIVPLLLFAFGISIKGKKEWPLLLTGMISLFIAMGSKAPLNLWKILHSLPVYSFIKVPSRYILGFIFCVSIFSGMALSNLEKQILKAKNRSKRSLFLMLPIGVTVFLLIDLYFVDFPIIAKTFNASPMQLERHGEFRQRYSRSYIPGFRNRSAMYPMAISQSGVINSYEVVGVKRGDVKIASDPDYQGEAYLTGGSDNVKITFFSPNKIAIDLNAKKSDKAVLNQNYYTGWRVMDNGIKREAKPYRGLVSTPVTPGRHRITFYYLPWSVIIGSCVSGISLLAFLFYLRRRI